MLMRNYYTGLFSAAGMTAAFAAIAHAVLIAVAGRSIGPELIYITALSFMIAWPVAVIGGAVLLTIVGMLKLRPLPAFILFFIIIQAVAIGLEMFFFEIGWQDISWQYGLISVPSAVIAWYRSIYRERNSKGVC